MAITRASQSTLANFNKYNQTSAGFQQDPELGVWMTLAGNSTTVFSSSDAFTWTSRTVPVIIPTFIGNINSGFTAFGGKLRLYAATLGFNTQRNYLETTDGINFLQGWSNSNTASMGAFRTTRAEDGTLYRAIGIVSGTTDRIHLWNGTAEFFVHNSGVPYELILKSNKIFVAINSTTAGNALKVSTDNGVTFTNAGPGTVSSFSSMATDGVSLVGAGVAAGVNRIWQSSDDGATWNNRAAINGSGTIRYLNGQFIAVAASGQIQTSPDGITWTLRTSGTANQLRDVAFGGGVFAACGNTGTVVTSPDGITWTLRTGLSGDLRAIGYA